MNRRIIYLKGKLGIYFTCWAFPLFLSIPLGSIIVAKFYKHKRKTFPLIILFLTLDCFLITGGTYFIKDLMLRSEEHTSELQSRPHLVCRLLLEKKKKK